MKVELEQLFHEPQFKIFIKENWIKEFEQNNKLQTKTKKALTNELKRHFQKVEYVKGNRYNKAHFIIDDKRDEQLTDLQMVEKGIYKKGYNNIANYKLTAVKLFSDYVAYQQLDDIKHNSMTRQKWLKSAGIISRLKELYMLNNNEDEDVSQAFIDYYKFDISNDFKDIFAFCIKQLKITSYENWYRDNKLVDRDEDEENSEEEIEASLIENDLLQSYNNYRTSIKKQYNVENVNMYNLPFEVKMKLNEWISENLESNQIWLEVELKFDNVKAKLLDDDEREQLQSQFIEEFKQHRHQKFVNREFYDAKGRMRKDAELKKLETIQISKIVPYQNYEERTYFKLMTKLDEKIGFGKADFKEYDAMTKNYNDQVEALNRKILGV